LSEPSRAAPWYIDPAAPEAAADRNLASSLAIEPVEVPPPHGLYLKREAAGLGLHRADGPRTHPLTLDLSALLAERMRGARQSPLAKACGLARPAPQHLCDATAGLGRDSVVAAWLGAEVTPIERCAPIYCLLLDAWQRAQSLSGAPSAWIQRLARPEPVDATTWLSQAVPGRFDTIYMDPMFAAARRKARPQKALAWLGELAGPDPDAAALLAAARRVAATRVVVKQHARSQPLATPSHQIQAKAVRFDVYLTGLGVSS
tara:strand:+ start:15474 stop:16253 length:780 start_codon:yes stop_codon:yes gene_type:complete